MPPAPPALETESWFRTLSDSSPVAIFRTDVDGFCSYVNERWQQLTGRSFDECLGEGWVRSIHPDDRVETFARWIAAVNDAHREFDMVYRVVRPNGEIRIAHARAARVHSPDGELVGWVGTVDDITERHQTQERMRLVLEATNDGFRDWNIETGEMIFSDGLLAMLGYTHREMPPQVSSWEVLVHPDDLPRVMHDLREHLEGATAQYENEHRLLCANGQWLWVLDRGRVVTRDSRGLPLRMISTHTDISERRKAEADLQQFFSLSLELLCVASIDGYFKRINPAFESLFGYAREEMLERPFLDFVHPDDREATLRELSSLRRGRFTVHFENRYVCKDGSTRWIAWTAAPVVDEGKIYAAARDITGAKVAEEALRESEQRTRSIIDNSVNGLITFDDDGVIRSTNPAADAMFGYESGELTRRHAAMVLPNLDRGALGRVTQSEARRKNGEVFPCEVSLFEFGSGSEKHVAAHVVDVSARFAVERMKDDFVSTVSHELRTPLTSIRGALGLLSSGVMGELSTDGGELVEIAERNAVRLIALVDHILDFEKLEHARAELELLATPIARVIERSVESVAAFACQESVSLDVAAIDGVALADEERLVQVVINLLSNAIKFSPLDGIVTVSAATSGTFVEVRVADRGPGISTAGRAKLFERFQQIDASDARRKGGTGLGLAICKGIIEQHGGTIGVDSEEGCGSTFWFRVPGAAA
ncbi:MAG TPA: PAS domain S-box protein [Thermoanaerobaculia bacterium]|nr:PAS domain S-box protein [Thermoanaerobaculia bacterium]